MLDRVQDGTDRIPVGYLPDRSAHAHGDIADDTLRTKDVVAGFLMAVMTLAPLAATGLLTP
ncbi:MAG TPA: hypothetical protein VJ890_25280 [Vineibacter sp.]|nr:hypothetical protein [Vineibacter sp.]